MLTTIDTVFDSSRREELNEGVRHLDLRTQVAHRAVVCARPARRTPSAAYFDDHDAPRRSVLRRCARMCTRALICRLVQERASRTDKIGNDNLRKVRPEFAEASTTIIASILHQLTTHTRSSLLSVLTGTALKCVALLKSNSALSACASMY